MKRNTTIYRLKKEGQTLTFQSEQEACDFLGVAKCSVASCYRRNGKCKGWQIEKIGSSTHGHTKSRLFKIWSGMHENLCIHMNVCPAYMVTQTACEHYLPQGNLIAVTRCRECIWWNHAGCAIRIVDDSDKPKETDFCSFSERRG